MQQDKSDHQAADDRLKRDIEFLRDEARKTRRERNNAQVAPDGGPIFNYRQNLTMRGEYMTRYLRELAQVARRSRGR